MRKLIGSSGKKFMRVALTTTGNNMDAPLDEHFGLTPKFLVYETETGSYIVTSNEYAGSETQHAGIKLALRLAEEHIDGVITRHVGPKAYETLTAARITVFICRAETVGEAIHQLKFGELTEAPAADVDAQWTEL
jgi:predicted Fe-Mo cluster-binding NifX family protein